MTSAAPQSAPVAVGLGELKVAATPGTTLTCYGLGSCVGVAIYDPSSRVGGLAHVVLPSSSLAPGDDPGARYADLAVPRLVEAVIAAGGRPDRFVCKVAGGAHILRVAAGVAGLDIGARNAEAVLAALEGTGLRPAAADLGGNAGRTMALHIPSCRVIVSSAGKVSREL